LQEDEEMSFKDYNEMQRELKSKGYKYLNWANGWGHNESLEYEECNRLGHNDYRNPDARSDVQHNPRGSTNTVYCDVCKIYWNYDCSD
jgi:hypothetical protein